MPITAAIITAAHGSTPYFSSTFNSRRRQLRRHQHIVLQNQPSTYSVCSVLLFQCAVSICLFLSSVLFSFSFFTQQPLSNSLCFLCLLFNLDIEGDFFFLLKCLSPHSLSLLVINRLLYLFDFVLFSSSSPSVCHMFTSLHVCIITAPLSVPSPDSSLPPLIRFLTFCCPSVVFHLTLH